MARRCEACGKSIDHRSPRAKYCDESCRDDYRKKGARAPSLAEMVADVAPGPVWTATSAELEGAPETAATAAALALANRIDHASADTGSAYAALIRQLHATVAEALKDAPRKSNWLDELARRREAKAAGA